MRLMHVVPFFILIGGMWLPLRAQETTPAKDAKSKTPVYNEKADAKVDIAAALAKAKKENRRVMLQWGGNWCGWCILLHDKLKSDPKLRQKLLYEYDVVTVDIGQMNKHMDLVKTYEAQIAKNGVPYITILDPDGKVLVNQETESFETKTADGKKGHDSAKLLEFLVKHQSPVQLRAEEVFEKALQEANKSDRLVFMHFGAPWCGWCHRLEDWMAKPQIAAILAKEFVDLKIDIDRMEGGKEILKRFNPDAKGGIPWFVFVDGKGKALATSDGPKGNVGFPYEEAEVAHFMKMLQSTNRRLSPKDHELIGASLKVLKKTS